MITGTKRLKILSKGEIETLYGLPKFSDDEKDEYFHLSRLEKSKLDELRSLKSKIYFILQLGYFRAKRRFFVFNFEQTGKDFSYVYEKDFLGSDISQLKNEKITKVTRLKQQRIILALTGYSQCSETFRKSLEIKAKNLGFLHSKPIYIFRKLWEYLDEEKIIAPGYSVMQGIVGTALNSEQERLTGILKSKLSEQNVKVLEDLLKDSEGFYKITELKHNPKDFSNKQIRIEIARCKSLKNLYTLGRQILPELNITNESIKYYASLVEYYSIFRLKQLKKFRSCLYLLCFSIYRYQKAQDNLVSCLIYLIRRYENKSKENSKEKLYESRLEISENLQGAAEILKLFTNDKIPDEEPFRNIRASAFEILNQGQIDRIAVNMARNLRADPKVFHWQYIDLVSGIFKLSLRPIIQCIDFATMANNKKILEKITLFKKIFAKNRSLKTYSTKNFNTDFFPAKQLPHFFVKNESGKKILAHDRYEFSLYRLLSNRIESGDIFCPHSLRYRSIDDDLLDDGTWENKAQLIDKYGLRFLNLPPKEHLLKLKTLLENRINEVNKRIESGENHLFKIKNRQTGNWVLEKEASEESVNNSFYDKLKQIDIVSLLHFANKNTRFIDCFEHALGRYTKQEKDYRCLIACIIAWGTNMGLGKMGQISDMSSSLLSDFSNNFIRLETLKKANDRINDAITKLPIFSHYNLDNIVHSSSDGQKYETSTHTINARHSPKYFGLKKGIVSYSMVLNHIPVNAKIIGANEHESHYVFDLIHNNNTDISPDIHSTDTHGTNNVNFAILNAFGYQFAPRYANLREKVKNNLCCFSNPDNFKDFLKPASKIKENLIEDEWDNMARIFVSLALKTTSQSNIIRKLSSTKRKNKTKRALNEYNKIFQSIYMLDYIDIPSLRKNVLIALNRGESYHKLRKAVAYANFGRIRFKLEAEQHIWNECARLITSVIIYYNASLQSKLLKYKEAIGQVDEIEKIKNISPVAWQHINFFGRYEFNKQPQNIDLNQIIKEISNIPIHKNQQNPNP